LATIAATSTGPFTLGVDIGGTYIKASVVDAAGKIIAAQLREATPKPALPAVVFDVIAGLAARLPPYDRISVGFPGVLRQGKVAKAANLGIEHWGGFPLIEAMGARFGRPVRALNDAAVHGLGVAEGKGLECVVTLGTGAGCALLRNRQLLLHLELGPYPHANCTYDAYIGQAALEAIGLEAWNERVEQAITTIMSLTWCDTLHIGGGNARRISFNLPANVRIADNSSGIVGSVRLWEKQFDSWFADLPSARPAS